MDYLAHLRADASAFAAAARDHLDLQVPSCPGWTVTDLVSHLGHVYAHKLPIVRDRLTRPPDATSWRPGAPPTQPDELLDWFERTTVALADVLAATGPDTPVWTWSSEQRAAFWRRRMAQETLVHRWDAQAAAGTPGPLDPQLAADGVDELLMIFLGAEDQTAYSGPHGRVALVATDTGDEWTVELSGPRPAATRGGEVQVDATVSGGAAELLLVGWRRLPSTAAQVTGDRDLVDAFLRWGDLD